MNITSLGFIIGLLVSIVIFYLLPNRLRWGFLLIISLYFISTYNLFGILFILFSSFIIFFFGKKIGTINKSDEKNNLQRKKKCFLVIAIILNLAVLLVLKYLGDYLGFVFNTENPFTLLIPVGLSYYTLQAISYLLDVYWDKISYEKSYPKILLFLCYFPQMLQGPISRYKDLSFQLIEKEHSFNPKNIKHGVQLILWGYLKLIVISDRVGEFVSKIFYSGITAYGFVVLWGLILFGFQLYCNFSGGIDIMRGVSECFGILLPQNFNQPFFSNSIGDFWRRWHITLGTWMKDYVFFPFSMSRPISKLKKKLKLHISKKMANRIPIAAGNIVVFFLVGLWHGTGTNYILWGLYNGVILAFSELMTDKYKKSKKLLHINEASKLWTVFCIFRTFIIITLGWCTDCASTASGAFQLILNLFMFGKTNFYMYDMSKLRTMLIFILIGIILVVDIIHEKNISIRDYFDKKPFVLQVIFWIIVIQFITLMGGSWSDGDLMYAVF